MGIIMKNCGRCGRPVPIWLKVGDKCPHCGVVFDYERGSAPAYSGRERSGAFFKLLLVAAVVGAALLVPLLRANRPDQESVQRLRQQFASQDASERVQASLVLAQSPRPVVVRLAVAYAQSLRSADPDTRVALIRNLADMESALRRSQRNARAPMLPADLLSALETARSDESAEVRAAAEETLAAIRAAGQK